MVPRLKLGGFQVGHFSDGRACLEVQFLDTEGNLRTWVPTWRNVYDLFEKASNTELVNKPDSHWMAEFAKTASAVFQKLDPHQEAYKTGGTLSKIRNGNLVITSYDSYEGNAVEEEELPVAFPITSQFLEEWLCEHVTVLVVNGFAIRLWEGTGTKGKTYPLRAEEAVPF